MLASTTPSQSRGSESIHRWADPCQAPGMTEGCEPTDSERTRQFLGIAATCRRWGGLATADEVLVLLRQRGADQPISKLARWIVRREVVSLQWRATTWLPLFQIDIAEMSPSRDVAPALRELSSVFDDWELMDWFTSPNTWLGGLPPIAAVKALPDGVHQAARADRFIALG